MHQNRSYDEGILLGRKLLIKVKILGILSGPLVHPIIPMFYAHQLHVPGLKPFGRTLLIGSHWAPGLVSNVQ